MRWPGRLPDYRRGHLPRIGQLFAISYAGGTGNDIVVTRIGGADRAQHPDQRRRGSTLGHRLESHVERARWVSPGQSRVHLSYPHRRRSGQFEATANVINGVTVVTLNGVHRSRNRIRLAPRRPIHADRARWPDHLRRAQLDGNGNGTPGDNYTFGDAQGLFRFFGDVNGDQSVNGLDLGFFRNAFGTSSRRSELSELLGLQRRRRHQRLRPRPVPHAIWHDVAVKTEDTVV